MINSDTLRILLPGIVTRIAISYPVAYISSISFQVKNKLLACCVWNNKTVLNRADYFKAVDEQSFCTIGRRSLNIKKSDVEITGTDEYGQSFFISTPYHHLIGNNLIV